MHFRVPPKNVDRSSYATTPYQKSGLSSSSTCNSWQQMPQRRWMRRWRYSWTCLCIISIHVTRSRNRLDCSARFHHCWAQLFNPQAAHQEQLPRPSRAQLLRLHNHRTRRITCPASKHLLRRLQTLARRSPTSPSRTCCRDPRSVHKCKTRAVLSCTTRAR